MMFASKLGEPPSVLHRLGIGERRFDFTRLVERVVESITKAQPSLSFPYF
jgi:hypothetical protein